MQDLKGNPKGRGEEGEMDGKKVERETGRRAGKTHAGQSHVATLFYRGALTFLRPGCLTSVLLSLSVWPPTSLKQTRQITEHAQHVTCLPSH